MREGDVEFHHLFLSNLTTESTKSAVTLVAHTTDVTLQMPDPH